jgi:hypothetical protein
LTSSDRSPIAERLERGDRAAEVAAPAVLPRGTSSASTAPRPRATSRRRRAWRCDDGRPRARRPWADPCSQGPLALGHRRLKIIDLSSPRRPADARRDLGLTIVFNGCIYNYPELRDELAGGYRFFSTSDTEVLLKAYHAWGDGRSSNGCRACSPS